MPPNADYGALIEAVQALLYELQNGDTGTVDYSIERVERVLATLSPIGRSGT